MTCDNDEKPHSKPLRLCSVDDLLQQPNGKWLTRSSVRHLVFDAEDRTGSGGSVIPGNGLASAIIRIGRRVLIDLDAFDDWIEEHRMPSRSAKCPSISDGSANVTATHKPAGAVNCTPGVAKESVVDKPRIAVGPSIVEGKGHG